MTFASEFSGEEQRVIGDHWLDLQLNVDASAGEFPAVAYRWFDELSARIAPEARQELAELPARGPGGKTRAAPLGVAGVLSGEVSTWELGDQRVLRTASAAGMRWLREQLASHLPRQARLYFSRLDEHSHRSGSLLSLTVEHLPESPAWLRLGATLPEALFLNPQQGTQLQQAYLQALWPFADQLNPGYGQVDYLMNGNTIFEHCIRGDGRPRDWWDHAYSVNNSRAFLRGYSWLTIVPRELVAPLGGIEALTDSGAFAQVRPLSGGGVWLLATEDYRDFDEQALRRVFRVVAPVLRPGMPTNYPPKPGESPNRLVFEDASEAAIR